MASAGQAQAHSSQPMHFSRPSGHRLSWCRPWNRGAVGFFSSGYWTVSTFWNIVLKVVPNPLTGSRKLGTGYLLRRAGVVGARGGRPDAQAADARADAVVVGQVQGRDRERGPVLALVLGHALLLGLIRPGRPLSRCLPAEPERQQRDHDQAGHDVYRGAAALPPPDATRREDQR